METIKRKNKIVYAYIVGDIIHIGHLRHLKRAKEEGDRLIVGVLTDEATMEKKFRPVIPFEERVEVVKALKYIDDIIIQNTYSPLPNVKKIKPDVLMESDSHSEMPANDFVKSYGGRVVITPYYRLQSSTKIKDKVFAERVKSHRISMLKSLVWRALSIFILVAVTYFFTRKWITTTQITIAHNLSFIMIFYLHERLWLLFKKEIGKWRNVLKSFTYEIILGMGIGGLIVFVFTGEWSKVTQITGTYTAIKLIMYYFYDRKWK